MAKKKVTPKEQTQAEPVLPTPAQVKGELIQRLRIKGMEKDMARLVFKIDNAAKELNELRSEYNELADKYIKAAGIRLAPEVDDAKDSD